MCPKALLPALAAGLLSLTACDVVLDGGGSLGHFTRDFHYNYPMDSKGVLSVETYNGSVEISGWDQNAVDVSGVKHGSSQEAADNLRIDIDHQPAMVSIRVERPSQLRNLGAKFVIKIPRGVRVDRVNSSNGAIRISDARGPARLHTSNGTIRVEGMKGELNAHTSNGAMELMDIDGEVVANTSNGPIRTDRLRGALEATTSNGGIHANLAWSDRTVKLQTSNAPIELSVPADFRSDIHADTSNNSITLRLPGDVNARVSARTSNASITSDFDLRMQGEISKHHINATLGSGGPLFDLSTSNGGIRLLKM